MIGRFGILKTKKLFELIEKLKNK